MILHAVLFIGLLGLGVSLLAATAGRFFAVAEALCLTAVRSLLPGADLPKQSDPKGGPV